MGNGEPRDPGDRVGRTLRASHLLDVAHDLREGEHADQHRQELDAALEELDAEREPRRSHHRVVAEDGDHQAEHPGEQPLGERGLDQAGDHRQRQHEEREEFPRPELEREGRERAGGGDEEHASDVHALHGGEALQRIEAERERQGHDDREGYGDAGQRPPDHADQRAHHERRQVLELDDVDDARGEVLVHQNPVHRPRGNSTCR